MDFEEYVDDFLDMIDQVVDGFNDFLSENYIQAPNMEHYFYRIDEDEDDIDEEEAEDIDDIFSTWLYDNDMYWNEDIADEWMNLDEWRYLYRLRKNSRFSLKFPKTTSEDEIRDAYIEHLVGEAILTIEDEDEIFNYLDPLVEEKLFLNGSIGDLDWGDKEEFEGLKETIEKNCKEELKKFVEDNGDDIFGNAAWDRIDWHEEVQSQSGYVSGTLSVKLNLETMNIPLASWKNYINTVFEMAYHFWYSERKPDNTIGEANWGNIYSIHASPDIFSHKKNNLRIR